MKRIVNLALGATILLSVEANALTKQCDQCSPLEMNFIAAQSEAEVQINEPLYVVDLYNGVVKKYLYLSSAEHSDTGGPIPVDATYSPKTIEEVSTEASIVELVQQASTHVRAMGQKTIFVNPNPDLPSDVYAAMTQSRWDLDLDRYIRTMTDAAALNRAVDMLSAFSGNGSFFNASALYVSVKLYFVDGSNAVFEWVPGTQMFKRKPGTERDGAGNAYPTSSSALPGQAFVFDNIDFNPSRHDDFYDMWSHISSLNVNVVDMRGTGTGGSGNVTVILCKTNGTCEIVMQN